MYIETKYICIYKIEEKFGPVNWDPNVKTLYCSDCIGKCCVGQDTKMFT